MEFGNHTAEVLVEALPYIKKFYGTTIVIKYGGHAMVDKEMREKVISDIVLMRFVGMNPILVHGGGPDINYQLEKENYQSKFVDGLRVTDSEVLDIAQMVLDGKVNQEIVALLQKHGGNAVGLSDINGDTAAAAIAAALKADKFFLLTDTDGILDKDGQRISQVTTDGLDALKADGTISGGMIPKAACCQHAIQKGVASAHIINGQMQHSLLLELFTDDGVGTMVVGGKQDEQ